MIKPWITKEILEKCYRRDSLLKNISVENDNGKLTILQNDCKKLWNEITKDKRESKKVYFTVYFERNKNKSAIVWKGIKSLVNIKSTKSSNIKLLDENKNIVSDSQKITNMFNEHFSSIGTKIKRKIPYQTGNFKDYLNRRDGKGNFFINTSNNSLFLSPTVLMEVEKIIDGLDMKKATGPNSIPNIILKSFKLFFSAWLSRLVNLCFEVGVFPDILKTAKITPLHKKDSKLDVINYRPISLLSVFSKIYEKVIYIRIYSYLTKNNLIYSKQFGFRSNYSTNHALTRSLKTFDRYLTKDNMFVAFSLT